MKFHGASGIYQATDEDGAECLVEAAGRGWRVKYVRPVVIPVVDDGETYLRSTVEAVTIDGLFAGRRIAAGVGCAAYRAARVQAKPTPVMPGILDRVYANYPLSLGVNRE